MQQGLRDENESKPDSDPAWKRSKKRGRMED